ncbi:MAG: LemA family protein [Pseudohongiella sp.]|nr:LemA family protein [Pseudohongiella sp.]MDO9518732.1 LemA family protein [Pseudohongiella sp.]MDP2126770.1 LemA family protein [Pseudohongiella sp.]
MIELLIAVVILLALSIWMYNRLIQDRNQVQAAWSDIDVQLMRRHDLVPQLVSTVKAYSSYEKATMEAVTELRSRSEAAAHLPEATHLPERARLEAEMESGIRRLIVLAEDYPDLKADSNFRQLQSELTAIEDHIQYARRFYNGSVRVYNTRIQSFPHLLIAVPFRFEPAEFFEVDNSSERAAPKVELR